MSKKYFVRIDGADGKMRATYSLKTSQKGELDEMKSLIEEFEPGCKPLKAYITNGDEKIAVINGEKEDGALLITPIEMFA